MKTFKYGKSFKDIYKIKESFIDENDSFLKRQNEIGKLYKDQPIRKKCKICNKKLNLDKKFESHKISYTICKSCTHVNGLHEDTSIFTNKVYSLNNKHSYSSRYFEKNIKLFNNRQKKIYQPKVDFLENFFLKKNKFPSIIEVGAGSGYFLSALSKSKFSNFIGYEISKEQVEFGKKILKKKQLNPNILNYTSELELLKIIKNTKFELVALIGVLEHMYYPREFLKIIKNNKNIKYVYLAVPMFSLSTIIESSFDKVHNKHLGGTHTHLFTEKSLNYLLNLNNFYSIHEWWFGSDFLDLFRSFIVTAKKHKNNNLLVDKISENLNLIDEFQLVLDKNKLSSSIHILYKRK